MTPLSVDLRKRSVQNWIFLVPLLTLIVVRLIFTASLRTPPVLGGGALANTLLNCLGLALVAVGLAVRVFARGWKVENSGGRLVTSGLYAYIRHPLYVASFLIGLGLCLILGDPVVLIGYVVLYLAMHAWVIHGEEGWMAGHWGEDYRLYASRVPRFIPRPRGRERAERVVPRHLTQAVAREADAICAWLGVAFLLLAWESLAEGAQTMAVVPLGLAAACLLLWPSLKRAARRSGGTSPPAPPLGREG
jgi:protein-S-isoprenylcysteine O-methyltransferase Ste14